MEHQHEFNNNEAVEHPLNQTPRPESLSSSAHASSPSSPFASASVSASASAAHPTTSSTSDQPMSERERRKSIQAILRDKKLSENQRRKSIQSLMDGRRRSSLVNFQQCKSSVASSSMGMAASAKIIQDQFADLDDGDDSKSKSTHSGNAALHESPGGGNHNTTNNQSRSALKKRSIIDYRRTESSSSGSYVNTSSIKVGVEEIHISGYPMLAAPHKIAYDLEGNPSGDPQKLEQNRPECTHYDRKCSIISPCCGMVFGCRICHDDCDELNVPIYRKEGGNSMGDAQPNRCIPVSAPATTPTPVPATRAENSSSQHIPRKIKVESGSIPKFSKRGSLSSIMSTISDTGDDVHHNIDRFAVEEIICRECFTRQTSKT